MLEAKLRGAFTVTAMRQPGELVATWPETDVAFVADEAGNLMHVRHITVQKQEVLPIVAFGEGLDTDQAISAIDSGAIDCLDLNRHRSDLAPRLELALRRRSPEFESRLRACARRANWPSSMATSAASSGSSQQAKVRNVSRVSWE